MDSLYYVCMLAGVAWLVVWSILPKPPGADAAWSPFDMAQDHPEPGGGGGDVGLRRRAGGAAGPRGHRVRGAPAPTPEAPSRPGAAGRGVHRPGGVRPARAGSVPRRR